MTFAEKNSLAFERERQLELQSAYRHVDLLSHCWRMKQVFVDLGLQLLRESCRINGKREKVRSRFSHSSLSYSSTA